MLHVSQMKMNVFVLLRVGSRDGDPGGRGSWWFTPVLQIAKPAGWAVAASTAERTLGHASRKAECLVGQALPVLLLEKGCRGHHATEIALEKSSFMSFHFIQGSGNASEEKDEE
ncbi:unnamed protein product [Clonostachys byssicola]|uniref:Uncharacterized protein n=1 Tax=Clonostachys byssicola TaxID=160290 RepID=A0A9N9UD77_9HYPO|nr:unnamed protein product [Clonostachys byssicola]